MKKYGILIGVTKTQETSIPMQTMIPEIDEIVNFYSPERIGEIDRETGFIQRESSLSRCNTDQRSGMLKDTNPQRDEFLRSRCMVCQIWSSSEYPVDSRESARGGSQSGTLQNQKCYHNCEPCRFYHYSSVSIRG